MSGSRSLSNSTSTTGPITCTTVPVPTPCFLPFFAATAISLLSLRLGWASARQRGCAANDVHQFARDCALAHGVGCQGVVPDQVRGVVRRVVHGQHLSGHLAGEVLEHGLVDLRLDVTRQECV